MVRCTSLKLTEYTIESLSAMLESVLYPVCFIEHACVFHRRKEMLREAGFAFTRIIPTRSIFNIVEALPA